MSALRVVNRRRLSIVVCVLAALLVSVAAVTAQGPRPQSPRPSASSGALGTAFTYQGQLKNGGVAVNAQCDFQFALYDALTLGSRIGVTQTVGGLTVTNGLFAAPIDFGAGAFTGDARFLNIQLRCPAGAYTALTTRQALTPAPTALSLPGLWTQQNATSPNLIGGYSGNFISPTVVGGTIGGGGASGAINRVTNDYGTVSGGYTNTASGGYSSVSGGNSNTASGTVSTVSGGDHNTASLDGSTVSGGVFNKASGYGSIVSGGDHNTASAVYSAVGGGYGNQASGPGALVGGGGFDGLIYAGNTATGNASTIGGGNGNATAGNYGTIGGGRDNNATADYSTVGGGVFNTAGGYGSMVPGGNGNTTAGAYSFAAGWNAHALHDGAFVWADTANLAGTPITSTARDQFLVRASGGVTMFTNPGATVGATLAPNSGSWSVLSDRNAKMNFADVDGRAVLAALASIPVETWSYKTQEASIRHMGPMAQDFHAAFGVGENDTTISTVDAQGAALAAIQGLNQVVQEKDARIVALEARVSALEQQHAGNASARQTGPSPELLLMAGMFGLNLTLGALVVVYARRAQRA